MRIYNSTAVFRMELDSDKPLMVRYFDDLYQTRFRIDSNWYHTMAFKIIIVFIVEFIPVSVSLYNFGFLICLESFGVFINNTFISSESHCSPLIYYTFLFLHQVNYGVFC